jgi:hypothetical protein
MSVVLLVVLLVLGSLLYSLGLFFGLVYLFTRWGGWSRLAQQFRAPSEPQGYAFSHQTLRVGPVRYRWSTRINFSPYGLYLRSGLPLHPPLLIPWQAVTGVKPDTLYWFPAVTLSIGQPQLASVTLFAKHWPLLAQFLPPQLNAGTPV